LRFGEKKKQLHKRASILRYITLPILLTHHIVTLSGSIVTIILYMQTYYVSPCQHVLYTCNSKEYLLLLTMCRHGTRTSSAFLYILI